MLLNFYYHILEKYRQRVKGKIISDDFDWDNYHIHYQDELNNDKNRVTAILKKGDYEFYKKELKKKTNIKPLHHNHRLLYETILQINPGTVLEVGCGGGDHLSNLKLLNSKIKLYGIDLLPKQLKILKKRHPKLKAKIEQFDITLPYSSKLPKADLVYTQAVIMHLKTANNYLVALANLFKCAKNYVILMENWTQHEFKKDIEFLFDNKMLSWKKLYFYQRKCPEMGNVPHIMIVSNKKLKYDKLRNYATMI